MAEARERQGMKRSELATALGVSRPYVTKLLRTGANATLAQVERVLAAMRFRLDVRPVRLARHIPKRPR